jgi:Domain of unknown function (DUF5916)/Carbohydrate family 9 binding domain-like
MRSTILFSAALLLAPAAVQTAAAQGAPAPAQAPAAAGARRAMQAARLTGQAPRLDGVLDEAAWQQVQPAVDFVQRAPNPGAPATLRSEARVLYDDGAVYVGIRMYDPHPDSIQAPIGRRDMTGVSSEWAHVMIDSYNDKRTAFRFSVNAAGVQKDAFHSGDTNEDLGWDAVWESAAKVDGEGWVAEYRIPLSQLRFSASDTAGAGGAQVWGLQVSREIARRSEVADWSQIRPDRQGFVSQFGELHGLRGLSSGRRLEVIPYSVARLTRAPGEEGNPFYQENDAFGSMGADLKYGITSNLTLTATINPDFGQVEADPSEVNLSGFESFFEERRPFFTEGSDIFRFNVAFPYFVRSTGFRNDQPFYSRRLGRSPQADNPRDFEFYDRPQATNILGAAKVSGKTSTGWSIGVLDALTAEEEVRFVDAGGREDRAVVEPLTNYLVARAIKDFRGGTSALGGIATAVHRDLGGGDPRLSFLTEAAYMVGLDGRHRFGGGNYELRGAVVGTHVVGGDEAIAGIQTRAGHYFQRPDADHLDFDPTRTSLSGWLADVKVEKTGGGHLRGGLYAHARSPELEMNDVGFQRSTDWILQGGWIGYHQYKPQGAFRRWDVNLNAWNGYSFGGERLTTGFNLNGSGGFKSNAGFWWNTDSELEALRADVLRGGPAFTGPAYSSGEVGFYTDSRKRLGLEMWVGGHREWETVGGGAYTGGNVSFRPSSRMRLSVGPRFSVSRDPWGYVANAFEGDGAGPEHFVFADLHQTTTSLTTRLDYAFTPKLTLELYAQPFISTGRYDDFWEVVAPRARRFEDRFRPYGSELSLDDGVYGVNLDADPEAEYTFEQPDFNFKELRSNMVVRWEYRPGSTLFVVWSQGRRNFDDPGDFSLGRDFGRLFDGGRSPSTNVLLLKVNYWLNL